MFDLIAIAFAVVVLFLIGVIAEWFNRNTFTE